MATCHGTGSLPYVVTRQPEHRSWEALHEAWHDNRVSRNILLLCNSQQRHLARLEVTGSASHAWRRGEKTEASCWEASRRCRITSLNEVGFYTRHPRHPRLSIAVYLKTWCRYDECNGRFQLPNSGVIRHSDREKRRYPPCSVETNRILSPACIS